MKSYNTAIFLALIICDTIYTLNEEKIINAWSKDTKGSNEDSVKYPITGKDYWITKTLSKNDYADWTCELENFVIIRQIYIEFNTPPDRLIVFASSNSKSMFLPLAKQSYDNKRQKRHTLYYYNKPSIIDVATSTPFKFIRLRLIITSHQGININMIKVKIYSDMKGSSNYMLSRLSLTANEYTRPEQYCLKYHNQLYTLVPCRECLLYKINQCTFSFEDITNNGTSLVFAKKENNIHFSIQNIYSSIKDNKLNDLSNELDYEKEIDEIISNSTYGNEYKVQNIFDFLKNNYWSSTLNQKPYCDNISFNITLKKEQIIKEITIHWVKKPEKYTIEFVDSTERKSILKWVDLFKEKGQTSVLKKINIKAKVIRVYLVYDNGGGNGKICIASIKKMRIFKNEIFFKNSDMLNTFYLIQLPLNGIKEISYSQGRIEEEIKESQNYYNSLIEMNQTFYKTYYINNKNIFETKIHLQLLLKREKFNQIKSILYDKIRLLIGKIHNIHGNNIQIFLPQQNTENISKIWDNYNTFYNLIENYSLKEKEIKSKLYASVNVNEKLQNELNSFLIHNTSHYPDMINYDIIHESLELSKNYAILAKLFTYNTENEMEMVKGNLESFKSIINELYTLDLNKVEMMIQFLQRIANEIDENHKFRNEYEQFKKRTKRINKY